MADLPTDPRQLARDILSGKISIEDLAREQARRRAGQAPGNRPTPPRPMGQGPMSDQRPVPIAPEVGTVPAAQQMPQQASRQVPAARPVPARPVPARPSPLQTRPVPPRPPPMPVRSVPQRRPAPPAQLPRPATQAMPGARQVPQSLAASLERAPARPAPPKPVPAPLGLVLNDRLNLRRAIVLSEIIGRPMALRDDEPFF